MSELPADVDLDDVHHIDASLRAIRLDALDAPKFQPLRLDEMFLRATRWKTSSTPAAPVRAPSPPRRAAIYPLPRPLDCDGASPLAGLFEYPELMPAVLGCFDDPRDLAVLCRVSRGFERIARKRLYESVWVRPWEENCHSKLVLLFESLSRNPDLCRLIKRLDVRFFPLATQGGERYDLDEQVEKAFSGMHALESLVWTRDKSLNPTLVERLSSLPNIRALEISGHSYRYYDPRLLGKMPRLEDLRIMMPDSAVKDSLVSIMKELGGRERGGLKTLGIICRSSPLVDDVMLKAMAPHLSNLRRLTLWGCTRVMRKGIFDVLRETEEIEELSLDALPHSELLDLSSCPELPSLHTFSLSISAPHRTPLFLTTADLPTLPRAPNLTALHLTLSGSRAHLPIDSLPHLLSQLDPSRLTRLSLLNLVIATPQLSSLLRAAPHLVELYISINGRVTILECEELRRSALEVLHVTAPEKWRPDGEDLCGLARDMGRLREVGSGNRVYEVFRREGRVELGRWGRTWTPGYFQIWRG